MVALAAALLNLVAADAVDEFIAHATTHYQQRLGLVLETYRATIVGGVEVLHPDLAH